MKRSLEQTGKPTNHYRLGSPAEKKLHGVASFDLGLVRLRYFYCYIGVWTDPYGDSARVYFQQAANRRAEFHFTDKEACREENTREKT